MFEAATDLNDCQCSLRVVSFFFLLFQTKPLKEICKELAKFTHSLWWTLLSDINFAHYNTKFSTQRQFLLHFLITQYISSNWACSGMCLFLNTVMILSYINICMFLQSNPLAFFVGETLLWELSQEINTNRTHNCMWLHF